MKYKICTLLFLLLPITVLAQTDWDSVFRNNADYRKLIYSEYASRYMMNADVGDMTFLDQGHPNGRQYVLNANIIPYFSVTSKRSPVYIVLNPIVRVRIFLNQNSLPVRTPSFVPGATFYFKPFKYNLARYKYMSIGVYHHSNGQDGEALNPDGSVNLVNGNFSTNFLKINFHYGRYKGKKNTYYRIGGEFHSGLIGVGDEEELRSKFGKIRLNYHYAISKYRTKRYQSGVGAVDPVITKYLLTRFVIDGMIVLDNIDAKFHQRFNIEFKFYYNPFDFTNTSFFASTGYMGHDYYNIYFTEPYPFIRIGIAAGLPLKPIEKTKRKLSYL